MKKILKSLIIIAFCMILTSTNAQDLITKTDGTDISAKVLEVTTSVIKYKKFENQDGPIYNIKKSDVLMIRYENGTKDIFNETVSSENISTSKKDGMYLTVEPDLNSGWVEMIVGKKVEVYKKNKRLILFIQGDNKLNYPKMVRKLYRIEACSENMNHARKYKTLKIIFFCAGAMIIPAVLVARKERKYVILALEDYNNSLK